MVFRNVDHICNENNVGMEEMYFVLVSQDTILHNMKLLSLSPFYL